MKDPITGTEGTVEDFLSSQFTVRWDDGTFSFLFYRDKGDTYTIITTHGE